MRMVLSNNVYDTEKAQVEGEWADFDTRGT